MKFNLKQYKLIKTKFIIKKQKILVFCHSINNITSKFIKLKQEMLKKRIKNFKIDSSLLNFLIKNSIYLNLKNLSYGPILILYFNMLQSFTKIIFNLDKINRLFFFCCLFNKKCYNLKNFLCLTTLKFVCNISILYKHFKKYIVIYFFSIMFLLNKKLFRNNVI